MRRDLFVAIALCSSSCAPAKVPAMVASNEPRAVAPHPSEKRRPPHEHVRTSPHVVATIPLSKEPIMERVLEEGGKALQKVMAAPEAHRFQILYALVDEGSPPTLERHGYRADAEYFFPASALKMPIAFATLARSTRAGIGRDVPLRIHPLAGSGEPFLTTIARETWRALIVSDNPSANRLIGVGGHREIHEQLWALDLRSARVRHGFSSEDPVDVSPRLEATAAKTRELASRKSNLALPPTDAVGLDVGRAAIVDGRRVEAPLSFATKNAMRLRDLQDALVRVVRPDILPGDPLTADDREYLKTTLRTPPSESGLAGYDRNVVADYQHNPLLRGIERVRSRSDLEIYSKVGQAYGFVVANTYVVEKSTGRSFFLAAVIYANPDEVVNDDVYAYETIAFPALADVGEVFTRDAFD